MKLLDLYEATYYAKSGGYSAYITFIQNNFGYLQRSASDLHWLNLWMRRSTHGR